MRNPSAVITLLSVLSFAIGDAQKYTRPDQIKAFRLVVNMPDHTVKTSMLSKEKNITLSDERRYLWYTSQKILETYGGISGKIIHGDYQSFYLNDQLRDQYIIDSGFISPHKTLFTTFTVHWPGWKQGRKKCREQLHKHAPSATW
jgi:hypothetical protein